MMSSKTKRNKPKSRPSANMINASNGGIIVEETSEVNIVRRMSEGLFASKVQYSYGILDPKESFCGRIKFLEQLHSAIQNPRDESGRDKLTVLSRMRVISGLGGVGKTETCRKYIVQYAEFYKNYIWINAESEETLTSDFLRLADKKLGIKIEQVEKEKPMQRPFEDILEEVYNKLCVQDTLIVFDNADGENGRTEANVPQDKSKKSATTNMEKLRRFLPPSILPPLRRPFILVSSRNQDFGGLGLKKEQIMPLDVFTEEESCQFIMEQLNLDVTLENNKDYALALGKLLGHLPLALQQNVARIREEIKNRRSDEPTLNIQNFVQAYQTEILRQDPFNFDHGLQYPPWKTPLEKIAQQGLVDGSQVDVTVMKEGHSYPLKSMEKLADHLPSLQEFQKKMQGNPREDALQKILAVFHLPVDASSSKTVMPRGMMTFGACFRGLHLGNCVANAYAGAGSHKTNENSMEQLKSIKTFVDGLKTDENKTGLTYTDFSSIAGVAAEFLLKAEFFDPRKLAIELMKRYYGEKKDRKYPRCIQKVFTKISRSNCKDAGEPAIEAFQSSTGVDPLPDGVGEKLMVPLACMFTARSCLNLHTENSLDFINRFELVKQALKIFHPEAQFLPYLYQMAISVVLFSGTRRETLGFSHSLSGEYQGIVKALEQATAPIPEAFHNQEEAITLWTLFLNECKDQRSFSKKQYQIEPSTPSLFTGLACFLWAFSYEGSPPKMHELFERTIHLALFHGGERVLEVASIAGSFAGAYAGELEVPRLYSSCEDHENFSLLGHRLFHKFQKKPPLDLRISQGFPALTLTEVVSKIKILRLISFTKDQSGKTGEEELAEIVATAVAIKECVDRAYMRVKIIGEKPAQQARQFLQNLLEEVEKIEPLPVKPRSENQDILSVSKHSMLNNIQIILNFRQLPDVLDKLDELVAAKKPPLRSLTQIIDHIPEVVADEKLCLSVKELTTKICHSTGVYRFCDFALAKVDRFCGSSDEQFIQFLKNLVAQILSTFEGKESAPGETDLYLTIKKRIVECTEQVLRC